MTNFFHQLLSFTRPERLGVLSLMGICVMLSFASRWITPAAPEKLPPETLDAFLRPVPSDTQHVSVATHSLGKTDTTRRVAVTATVNKVPVAKLFPFDPNTASEEILRRLGLPPRTVQTVLNYRAKGGQFRQPSDLQRIYGLRPEDYARLEPYIQIAQLQSVPRKAYQPRRNVQILINQATAAEWAELYGIGPVLSRRIVEFRERLGGFYQIDQVAETYGLPDSTWQRIEPKLLLEQPIRKILFDTASVEGLARHPYIRWKTARLLVAFREQHWPIRAATQLEEMRALPPEVLVKLAPYLSFEIIRTNE